LTGSDICEIIFSILTGSGQIKAGQRTFTAEQVKRDFNGVTAMKLMEHITFKRNHLKQEFNHKIMEDQSLPDADLLAYPQEQEAVERWNSGFDEARVACRSMGMKPVREGGIIPDDQWDEPWVGETADVKEMADDHEQD
jgi:hypothetical protein